MPLAVSHEYDYPPATSRLKIDEDGTGCNEYDVCVKMCLRDDRIPDYIRNGQRVHWVMYELRQTCITLCAKDALKLSFGFEIGGKGLLWVRVPLAGRKTA